VIALSFAARHPTLVPAVVAYEAPMPWLPWWPSNSAGGATIADGGAAADAAEHFMRRIVGDERWDALPERTRAQRRAEGPALVAELRSLRPPHPAPYDAADLTMPVVAAHGSRSRPHHQESALRLATTAPRGELAIIEGAEHGAHLSHPELFAGLVRQALDRAGQPPGRPDRRTAP
jgi:pimeloyl-ACP methyl ester carboxylesterase